MTKEFRLTKNDPIVSTESGKVRGFFYDSTYTFYGIPYARAARWEMPEKIPAWEGVKDALGYGYICPILSQPKPSMELLVTHQFWPENEQCQNLNVWTQSVDSSAKKPVIVWFHGGGYSSGSSIEQVSYDGKSLSKYGDVVVVTVNHRLNVFGFLDLSPYGEKYANSKNVGMADCVAALQWVHDNIENFGGDPGNVTIMGQSGGGGKVSVLGQIPSAAGLFHKAVIMSGICNQSNMAGNAPSEVFVPAICKALGLEGTDIEALAKAPTSLLIRAVNQASDEMRKLGYRIHWCPTKNDWFLGYPGEDAEFCEFEKSVPTIVGSVIDEIGMCSYEKDNCDYTDEEKRAFIAERFGEDNADAIIAAFKKAYPDHKDLLEINDIDLIFRPYSMPYVTQRAQLNAAPTYNYVVSKVFDFENGKAAWHCCDIPFVFRNNHLIPLYQGDEELTRLQDEMSNALLAFMRTGNPNAEGLPEWPAVTPDTRWTMLFDSTSKAVANHDEELITLCQSHAKDGHIVRSKPRAVFSVNMEEESGRDWLY